jgi:hypothetical protein
VDVEPLADTGVTNKARPLGERRGSRVHAANAIIVSPEGVTNIVGPPGPIIPVLLVNSSCG